MSENTNKFNSCDSCDHFFINIILSILIILLSMFTYSAYSKLSFAAKCGELGEMVYTRYDASIYPNCKVKGLSVYEEERLDKLITYYRIREIEINEKR